MRTGWYKTTQSTAITFGESSSQALNERERGELVKQVARQRSSFNAAGSEAQPAKIMVKLTVKMTQGEPRVQLALRVNKPALMLVGIAHKIKGHRVLAREIFC